MKAPERTQAEIIAEIKYLHRLRLHAMGNQQVLDRRLESLVRVQFTEWTPDASKEERAVYKKQVQQIIAQARKGVGDPLIIGAVKRTDLARKPDDTARDDLEKQMERLARTLPAAPWVKGVCGAALGGVAMIIGVAGNLSNYANPGKLWKRLGLAPYQGHAASTWMVEDWRPRSLTKDEWTELGYSPRRRSIAYQIGEPLFRAQWVGAAKTEDGNGRPKGPYGEVYARRRAHTAITHPDWTKMHAHKDAMRVMTKTYIRDLWVAWCDAQIGEGHADTETHWPVALATQETLTALKPSSAVSPAPSSPAPAAAPGEAVANRAVKPKAPLPPPQPAGQPARGTHDQFASRSSKRKATGQVKPMGALPSAPAAVTATTILKPIRTVPSPPSSHKRSRRTAFVEAAE